MPHLEKDKLLSHKARLSRGRIAVYGGLAAVVGIVVVVVIFAASGSLAFEAESGTLAGPAKVVSNSGASGGKAIQFGSGATATPTPTTPPTSTPSGGWPGASNTGVPAGTTLTASGSITASTSGQVISGKNITGTITINASNVTIKDTKINAGTNGFAISVNSGSVTVEDTEIDGTAYGAIEGDNYTLLRCNIDGVHGDGAKLGNNTTIQDSWIHDFVTQGGQHADGMQAQNGLSNVMVKHNYVDPNEAGSDSAVFIKNDLGPNNTTGPITVTDNLLGGGGYTLYVYKGGSGLAQGGVTVTNNRFLRDQQYGPVAVNIPVVAWSGNVWNDTGATISQ